MKSNRGNIVQNSAGNAFESVDAAGRVTRRVFDAAGRETATIGNFTPCDEAGNYCPGNEQNVVVRRTYDPDGNTATLTAVNPATGDQTTTYLRGVDFESGSALCSNDLLRAVVYPDSVDADDRVRYAYNRQAEVVGMNDQNGTAHAYALDKLGRQRTDAATLKPAARRVVPSVRSPSIGRGPC